MQPSMTKNPFSLSANCFEMAHRLKTTPTWTANLMSLKLLFDRGMLTVKQSIQVHALSTINRLVDPMIDRLIPW
jgi:hypothetical protein